MERLGTERARLYRTTDKWLLLFCILLSGFSCLVITSCYLAGFIRLNVVITQAGAMVLGIFAASLISLVDYHTIVKLWPLWAGTSLVLCLLLLTPLGYTPPGSDDRAWLRLFGFSLQPSELLKLSFAATFSLHLSKVRERMNTPGHFLLLCLHGGGYTMLVMFQGDYGSATVFFAMFIIMMFAAGLSVKLLLVGILLAAGEVPLVWNFVLPDYLKKRFYVAWNPASDPLGGGYQQYRGQIALGSGQWSGRGLFSDSLISVPEAHNDFIFAYIGQTLGLAGCAATVLGIALICGKILWTAHRSEDFLGCSLCCGVFAIIFYQALINIGMVLCVIPVIGITLPFVSGGGTSLLISYLGIGMVMSVARQNRIERIFH